MDGCKEWVIDNAGMKDGGVNTIMMLSKQSMLGFSFMQCHAK